MDKPLIEVHLQQNLPIPLDIHLNCQSGEVIALVGPSGSGKTTVLRSIAGLYKANTGYIKCADQIWFDTENQINTPAYQRHVGMVFQNYALFPHLTALQNIIQALPGMPKHAAIAQAKKLLRKVHLGGLEQRLPKALSGGQQQRVAVARALARTPKVLLLDEPFSSVDQVTRRRLYRELMELRRSLSQPIIIVTHDLEEATLLADRLYILHKGVTLQSGKPEIVAAKPADALVARLMDQQNIFSGKIIEHDLENKKTRLEWHNYTIEAELQSEFDPGHSVNWVIQPTNILLHRRHRHSNGEKENPFSGIIIEYFILAGYANIVVRIDQNIKLSLSVPLHVAQRNCLAYGEKIGISLLAKGIHLMPCKTVR